MYVAKSQPLLYDKIKNGIVCSYKKKKKKRGENKYKYLRNDDVPHTIILVSLSRAVRMGVGVGVGVSQIVSGFLDVAVTRVLRVAVSMVRRVGMHSHDVHPTAFLFSKNRPIPVFRLGRDYTRLKTRIVRPDPHLVLAGPGQALFALVILSAHEVNEQCGKRCHHGEESRKWELGPGEFR